MSKWIAIKDQKPHDEEVTFITDGKVLAIAMYGKKEQRFLGCGFSVTTFTDWNYIPFEPTWWLKIPSGVDFGRLLEGSDAPWEEVVVNV